MPWMHTRTNSYHTTPDCDTHATLPLAIRPTQRTALRQVPCCMCDRSPSMHASTLERMTRVCSSIEQWRNTAQQGLLHHAAKAEPSIAHCIHQSIAFMICITDGCHALHVNICHDSGKRNACVLTHVIVIITQQKRICHIGPKPVHNVLSSIPLATGDGIEVSLANIVRAGQTWL